MVVGIDYQLVSTGSGANRTHRLSFTFTNPGNDVPIQERFDQMALEIRRAIRNHFRRNDDTREYENPYLIEFQPRSETGSGSNRQRMARNAVRITGEWLMSTYESILHSQDGVGLDGLTVLYLFYFFKLFKILVQVIGRLMRRAPGLQGGARNPGMSLIPKHLTQKGLGDHCDMKRFMDKTNGQRPDAPCGILAFLLGYNTDYYMKDFEGWVTDASTYGHLIGLESKFMRNDQFKLLLDLAFSDYRVLIFRRDGKVELPIPGDDWSWPEDLLRTEPDPKTIYILRDPIEEHYWWITTVKQCAFPNVNSKQKTCYICFRQAQKGITFDDHSCNGVQVYQCRICKFNFISAESLNDHKSRSTDTLSCEGCEKTRFNGQMCFDRHERENCNTPIGKLPSKRCDDCNRPISERKPHDCSYWGKCRICEHVYVDKQDYESSHRCFLPHLKAFWDPNPTGKFICHFAYDFETCREIIPEDQLEAGVTSFRHEVMAWAIQLIIPCEQSRQYVLNYNFREKIIEKIASAPGRMKTDITAVLLANESIRIRGKDLLSFVFFCTDILVKKKQKDDKWVPTLWAHNGSKFDSKFLFDYFVNEENMDLAGATYDEEKSEKSGSKWTRHAPSKERKNVCKVAMIGSKILTLEARGLKFQCSYAHHPKPLRALPKMFGLTIETKKGEFPYPLLKRENWGKVFPTFPSLDLFEIDSMSSDRRLEVLRWYNAQELDQPWDFDKELWGYLDMDVHVLCKVMEAYHEKAVELHQDIWRKYDRDECRDEKLVSPLQKSTSPGWAFQMYRTWFMPENQLAVLRPGKDENGEAPFVRGSLRGGRTDKRANYMSLDTPYDTIEYVDFKSLYPSVQDCTVHDTHYPVGEPSWGRFNGPSSNDKLKRDMGNKTGFLRISCTPRKYVTHPTLHRVGKYNESEQGVKLLFENDSKIAQVYAWPEIEEAIRCDEIDITHVHDVLLFDKGTEVFKDYIDFFFKMKEDAERAGNKGLRELAKLLLNSLWGKLGQRSYNETEWVNSTVRLDYLAQKYESGEFEMISCHLKDEYRAYFEYKKPEDFKNLGTTACQIAAFVSMWGRVILHRKLLHPHGMRAMYCDTDSAIVYLRHGIDDMYYLGNGLGQLTNEVKKIAPETFKQPFINQVVMLAPKTYALEIRDRLDPTLFYHKVVCKGFEPSFANAQEINFKSFVELVFTYYNLNEFMNGKRPGHQDVDERSMIKGKSRLTFRSSISRNQLVPVECQVQKNLSGDYTKGQVHPNDPRFIAPFSRMGLEPKAGTFLTKRREHFD